MLNYDYETVYRDADNFHIVAKLKNTEIYKVFYISDLLSENIGAFREVKHAVFSNVNDAIEYINKRKCYIDVMLYDDNRFTNIKKLKLSEKLVYGVLILTIAINVANIIL